MNLFWGQFTLACKRLWRSPAEWLALALVPLLVGLAAWGLRGAGGAVAIGVYTGGQQTACQALEQLRGSGLPGARFVEYADAPALRRDVAAGRLECGVEFGGGFDAQVRAGRLRGGITLVQGGGTTLAPLVQEAVSAALLTVLAPQLARQYLQTAAPGLALPAEEQWQAAYQAYLQGPGMMQLQVSTLSGAPAQMPAQSLAWPLALAFSAAGLLAWWVWGGLALGRRLAGGGPLARAAVYAPLGLLLAPLLAAQALPALGAALASAALAGLLPGGRSGPGVLCLAAAFALLGQALSAALALACAAKKRAPAAR